MSNHRRHKKYRLRRWHYLTIRLAQEMKLEFGEWATKLVASILITHLTLTTNAAPWMGLTALTILNSKVLADLRQAWKMVRETEGGTIGSNKDGSK